MSSTPLGLRTFKLAESLDLAVPTNSPEFVGKTPPGWERVAGKELRQVSRLRAAGGFAQRLKCDARLAFADKCRSVPEHLARSLGSTDDSSGYSGVPSPLLDWLADLSARFESVWRAESGNGLLELFADLVEAIRF